MNKNGRIDILLIIGTLIMLALSIGILELNHIINIRALFGGDGTFIPINYENELINACNSLNREGIYNEKMAEEVTQNIYSHMSADNKLSLDDFEKEYWKIVENKEYCLNNKCFYGAKGKKKTLYTYDCQEKKYDEIDLKIYYDELNSKYELEVACTLMNNNGFYKNADETISCSNYTCRWSRNGRLYYKNCKDK